MEKELYTAPEMEIVEFEVEDVMTTSGDIDEGEGGLGDIFPPL